jgi:peptide/nickel transport system ATP-binding protein
VLLRPRHPYTSGLLRSLPRLAQHRGQLPSIRGRVPSPNEMPAGCRFKDRCDHALPTCAAEQTLAAVAPNHLARCVRAAELNLPGSVA